MKRKTIIQLAIVALSFALYITLIVKNANGYLIRLQAYIDLPLITGMTWIFMMWLCIVILKGDTGFMKIGAGLGVFGSAFVLLFSIVSNEASYEMVTSSDYELIVEVIDMPLSQRINLYEQNDLFFSKYLDYVIVSTNYVITYEIVDDSFVIYKCLDTVCDTESIELN